MTRDVQELKYSAVITTNLQNDNASEFIQISRSWLVKGELSCRSCYHNQFHHCQEPDRHHRSSWRMKCDLRLHWCHIGDSEC